MLSKAAVFNYSDIYPTYTVSGGPRLFNLKQGCNGGDPLL